MSYHVSKICNKLGYTNFWSPNDWLGFTFSNDNRLKRSFSFELSDEEEEKFTLRATVWLMKRKKVVKTWEKRIAVDLPIEKYQEDEFRFFKDAIQALEEVSPDELIEVSFKE